MFKVRRLLWSIQQTYVQGKPLQHGASVLVLWGIYHLRFFFCQRYLPPPLFLYLKVTMSSLWLSEEPNLRWKYGPRKLSVARALVHSYKSTWWEVWTVKKREVEGAFIWETLWLYLWEVEGDQWTGITKDPHLAQPPQCGSPPQLSEP